MQEVEDGVRVVIRRPKSDKEAKGRRPPDGGEGWPGRCRDSRRPPIMTGVVRRRIEQASEVKLLQGTQGYATSLAAVRGREQRNEVLTDIGTLIPRYLGESVLTFEGEVFRKRARRLSTTSRLDPPVTDAAARRTDLTGSVGDTGADSGDAA